MNEKLEYRVADHFFCIETPDRALTSGIMSSYTPFRVENNSDNDFLFRLKGKMIIRSSS